MEWCEQHKNHLFKTSPLAIFCSNTLQCAALNLQLLEPHEVGSLAPALSLLHCVPSLYNIVEINTSTSE